jgi:hypothetical protein
MTFASYALWRRAGFWALAYAGLILLFAFFYWLLPPDSFWHSASEHEVSLRRGMPALADSLNGAIVRTTRERSGVSWVESSGWRLDWVLQRPRGLSVDDDGYVVLHYLLKLERRDDGALESSTQYTDFRFPAELDYWLESPGGRVRKGLAAEARDLWGPAAWDLPIPPDELVPQPPASSQIARNGVLVVLPQPKWVSSSDYAPDFDFDIVISRRLQLDLARFRAAATGYPGLGTGGFARMLYLSVVTITTLGFGDIVPMSETARTLVATEVLLGIAVMGFFVNAAVGTRRGEARARHLTSVYSRRRIARRRAAPKSRPRRG